MFLSGRPHGLENPSRQLGIGGLPWRLPLPAAPATARTSDQGLEGRTFEPCPSRLMLRDVTTLDLTIENAARRDLAGSRKKRTYLDKITGIEPTSGYSLAFGILQSPGYLLIMT